MDGSDARLPPSSARVSTNITYRRVVYHYELWDFAAHRLLAPSQATPKYQLSLTMPRGGNGKADSFSPYKAADGRELRLLKSMSNNSKTGYLNVVELHPGKFYCKKKLDDDKGSKRMKVFGKGEVSARAAAIKLAETWTSRTSCRRPRSAR